MTRSNLNKLRLSKKTISKLGGQIKGGNLGLGITDQTCILVGPSCHGGQTCNEPCTVTVTVTTKPTNEIK